MQPWVYAVIAVLPISAFWTAYQVFKILERRSSSRKDYKDE